MEGLRLGVPFGGKNDSEYVLRSMMWVRQLLAIQCSQREIDLHGERRHRGTDGSGHGTNL